MEGGGAVKCGKMGDGRGSRRQQGAAGAGAEGREGAAGATGGAAGEGAGGGGLEGGTADARDSQGCVADAPERARPVAGSNEADRALIAFLAGSWEANRSIELLGPSPSQEGARAGIVSFMIRCGELYLHYNFVTALLNDLFGIQVTGREALQLTLDSGAGSWGLCMCRAIRTGAARAGTRGR